MDTPDEDDADDLDYSIALMQALAAEKASVGSLTKELDGFVRVLRPLDPLRTAATIGGLLARPELQANCASLEMLVHLVVRHAGGTRKPSCDTMVRMFRTIVSSPTGRLDNPSEDLFVSVVSSKKGNFRVFGGINEGASFHLRAFLEIVDDMPPYAAFERMRHAIYGLLRVSDAVAERMALQRHAVGEMLPQKSIPPRLLDALPACRESVTFSNADLLGVGTDPEILKDFVFSLADRGDLDDETFGNTSLDRRPLLLTENGFILALPTAVSAAIRREVIETCLGMRAEQTLHDALKDWYARFFSRLPLLGGKVSSPVQFRRVEGVALANFGAPIDIGRWLHVLVLMDDFAGYEDGGMTGSNAEPERASSAVQVAINHARSNVSQRPGFQAGMTLVVTCGWGRGLALAIDPPVDGWRVEAVPAHDLETLSSLPGLKPTTIWRTLDMVEEIERRGLKIGNTGNLLNLVAWARGLGEQLVPRARLAADSIVPGRTSVMVIDQSALQPTRQEAAFALDAHRLLDTEGSWVAVLRVGRSDFAEDARRPEYASAEELWLRRLKGAFVTPVRTWWIEVPWGASPRIVYKYWEMLLHWLGEAAPVLEAELPGLPDGPIRWLASFDGLVDGPLAIPEAMDASEIGSLVSAVVASDPRTISLVIAPRFQEAFHRVDNAAERALLASFTKATAHLAGTEITEQEADAIAGRIVKVPEARHMHMFSQRTFLQLVSESLPPKHVVITKQDDAHLKIGLGWRARSRIAGSAIQGKTECMAFLNATVADLEQDLCATLRKYQKRALLRRVLLNHEATAADRAQWMDTSSAVIALRHDEEGVRLTLARKEAERNAVFLASRVLIEAAMCEASEDGEEEIGDIVLGRLMALASGIFLTGGWSDAIHWDAMEPKLQISPMGEILTASTFEEAVLVPFGQASTNVRVGNAIAEYPRNYEPPAAERDISSVLGSEFVTAWQSEFGFSLDQCRTMTGIVEKVAIDRKEVMFEIRRSELLRLFESGGLPAEAASNFVSGLSMMPRSGWKTVPEGYRSRDIEAWRFRRRLSLLRRPLLSLSGADDADPEILVAPGVIGEAIKYQVRSFHDGDFDKSVATSKAMRSWIGATNDHQGHAFNGEVAERMRGLGWEAQSEVKITRLLGQGFGSKDYGDVDVLAWNRETGRVLLIECKDLLFGKTHGEIAEQMSKFRGEVRPDGKPDLLLKHLNRMAVASAHIAAVKRFTGCLKEPIIESHLVFRHPVPMRYAWDQLSHKAHLNLFDHLDKL